MVEGIEEIGISNNTTEDSLIVTEEDKSHLTRDSDCGSELEAFAVPVEVRGSDHDSGIGIEMMGMGGG